MYVTKAVRRGGYRELGLVSSRLGQRQFTSPSRLTEAVETCEHDTGSNGFRLRGAHRVPVGDRNELAHVYLALRERYPSVRCDWLALAADPYNVGGNATWAGWSWPYPVCIPRSHAVAVAGDHRRRTVVDLLGTTAAGRSELRRRALVRAKDLRTTGVIELGASNWRASVKGRDDDFERPALATTDTTYYLVHEFGHLVEGRLWELGPDAVTTVFGAVAAVLGGRRARTGSGPDHLVNYPRTRGWPAGPMPQRSRRNWRARIETQLGSYASLNREELLAEAFAYSYAGPAGTRARWRPLRRALVEVGLGTSRRP